VEDLSVVALLGRLAVSMAVVLTLLGLAAKLLRRRGLGGTGGGSTRIEVLARHGLGRTSSVQLVRVAGRTLVLGVTDTSVSLLGEGEALGLEVADPSRTGSPVSQLVPAPRSGAQRPGWGPLLEAVKDRTARS
jgi:flagellar protein FliO/FliZ